jgi:sarcosine/dimethylglycine N-methyltransferase
MMQQKMQRTEHLVQNYGSNPIAVRDTSKYQTEYIQGFVEKWDALIGWQARARGEGDFFIEALRERGVKRILDVATGTGFHSIRLWQAGFEVVSADGSPEMLAKAFENGRRNGLVLRTVQSDWRWLNKAIHGEFDAVICLGNSFTHLFTERDRRKTLAEFYAALKHDGLLIIDHRNYDTILDRGFKTKHTYYYCGANVKAEPEHVDEGLARFRYEFPDQSVYHLNMFPIRQGHIRRLMNEVGFQRITTYGDFQETYHHEEPDFLIHVAEKSYDSGNDLEPEGKKSRRSYTSSVVNTARDYYNSEGADRFYAQVWGGEDIHIGLYEGDMDDIFAASQRTVVKMASLLDLNADQTVLDVGAGYGGAARYLAKTIGCQVTCLNLSEVQNERNRQLNREQGLTDKITVVDGNFEEIPSEDEAFSVVWSQDAILHSGNRTQVIQEVARVLQSGGDFIFTDIMQQDDCPDGVLAPVLARIHLDSLGSLGFYREVTAAARFKEVQFVDLTHQLVNHYSAVLAAVNQRQDEVIVSCGKDYIERMKVGLQHWINAGKQGYLQWGILHFRKS